VLQQVAPPQELYDNPVNLFVGGFIGSPAMNMFEATVERANGGLAAVAEGQRLQISEELLADHQGLKAYEGRTVIVGVRPENLEDASLVEDAPEDARLRGRVDLTEALGSELMVHFTIEAKPAVTEDVKELARDVGETVSEEADETEMVGRFDPHSRARQGETIEAVVDTRSLHFFDPETGAGIYSDEGKGAQA
jgi:multiple sugar transport system ATP-binding protein